MYITSHTKTWFVWLTLSLALSVYCFLFFSCSFLCLSLIMLSECVTHTFLQSPSSVCTYASTGTGAHTHTHTCIFLWADGSPGRGCSCIPPGCYNYFISQRCVLWVSSWAGTEGWTELEKRGVGWRKWRERKEEGRGCHF